MAKRKRARGVSRGRRLTPDEVAKINKARKEVEEELPEIIERNRQRVQARRKKAASELKMASGQGVFLILQEERIAQGLSLADLRERTGIDRSNLVRLMKGDTNPTLETIQRVAAALGKEVRVELVDKKKGR